ncbi:MAG TPA: metalloregulator ArsR/SmtB family transcription factor [Woeseiaceae bacterium]|nr:metalloregulator ArsR/SmtB family transcription factor [Woeseiaceae bacterium]
METDKNLDAVFFALSDSRRRWLLAELAAGPRSVSELATSAGMKTSAASKHIAVLEAGRLLYKTRAGRHLYCHLNFDIWREVAGYVAMHAKFWAGRIDELEAHLKEAGGS